VETWYWTIFALLFGACTGSFLNVVIYRWPRGISLLSPSRSFCPTCSQPIAWYDNLPVLSYLRLGGRCRSCRNPISLRYPFVELATMLVFVMTFDAFFAARQRFGVGDMGDDWVILIAHWALWAGMIALAVMDLEAYMVDVNVTWSLLLIGLIGHVFWTPPRSVEWIRPSPTLAAFALAVTVGLAVGALLFLRGPEEPSPEQSADEEAPAAPSVTSPRGRIPIGLLVAVVFVVGYAVAVSLMGEQPRLRRPQLPDHSAVFSQSAEASQIDAGAIRLATGLALAFVGLVLAASQPSPEADQEIVDAIHEEAPKSRRNALLELRLLLPAFVLVGVLMFVLASSQRTSFETHVRDVVHWSPAGHWKPIWGLSTALSGWVIGGAIGWFTRIVGTLLLGKEALGMGDVHIMAAAGAVAGWPVVLIGFFLAAVLALLGLIVIHFRRQSRALPYGPWLALGFLVASVYQDRILLFLQVRWLLEQSL